MQQVFKRIGFMILLGLLFSAGNGQTSSSFVSFNSNRRADIDKIIKEIGDSRIVAMGEDTHGTKEYYELRMEITRRLITEKGFNVFILENPYEDMIAFQENLYTVSLDTLMKKHLFSIYQTREMRNFLQWLKTEVPAQKIRIAGADDSYRDILPEKLKKEVKQYNDAVLDSLALDFENRQLLSSKEYYNLPQHKSTKAKPNDTRYGYDTYRTVCLLDSLVALKKNSTKMLEELIYQARSNYEIYWGFMNKKFLSRDSAMGNRINYFAGDPENKIIVWAHNAHIVRSPLDGEIGVMGETVNKKNPGQYFAIGFSSLKGSYSYMKNRFINDDHNFADTLFPASLLPPAKGSWNEYLVQQKKKNYIINFRKLSPEQKEVFNQVKPLREIGYLKEDPKKANFNTALCPLFDLLIVLKKTKHTTPLFLK